MECKYIAPLLEYTTLPAAFPDLNVSMCMAYVHPKRVNYIYIYIISGSNWVLIVYGNVCFYMAVWLLLYVLVL